MTGKFTVILYKVRRALPIALVLSKFTKAFLRRIIRGSIVYPLFAAVSLLTPPSFAAEISAATWYHFQFGAVGSLATGSDAGLGYSNPGNSPWTFTAPVGGIEFRVTDGALPGDGFDVLDFGLLVGTTPTVSSNPNYSCGASPDACFADPAMSHGSFLLPAGPHEITIRTAVSPFGAGSVAFFREAPAVPEPNSLGLLALALVIVAFKRHGCKLSRSWRNSKCTESTVT